MAFEARVIAAHGRHLLVRDAAGTDHEARPFGRRLQAVCGDRVSCEADAAHGEVHATGVLPRQSVLERANTRGGAEAVVANIDLLVTVLAPEPRPDPFIIDRYLCAASSAGLAALVVVNKCELPEAAALSPQLAVWRDAGYGTLACSSATGEGLEALAAALRGHDAVFVGQSGVGKSSLIARLVPQADIAVGGLDRDAEGRHTTTASKLYDLPGGGHLLDSPGVRDFAPAIAALERRSLGFPEVGELSAGCRFIDCRHLREPDCAVRTAAETGAFDARRYESYRRLRRLYEDLQAAAGPGKRDRR
ncbi:MAG: ribosome small subunit-dependent GTPase A [Gammaproteobacteria bacterium]|nr:ribosome small subunit-dependent GTPase A [Gammaproteobacteria bacterium]